MRVILETADGEHELEQTPSGDAAAAAVPCPACGAASVRVQGTGRSIGPGGRHYRATAVAVCCGATVGTIRAYPDTLFGLHEDEAVLVHGRCRVY